MNFHKPSLRTVGLASLIGITSLAVGATSSYYLVPVYLLAMAWLLSARPGPSELPPQPSHERINDRPVEPQMEAHPAEPSIQTRDELADPEQALAPKRSRSRTRKPRSKPKSKAEDVPIAAPVVATWVQVAPGKFVRVELPELRSQTEGPTTKPTVPRTESEPHRDLLPAVEAASVDELSEACDPGNNREQAVIETDDSPVMFVDTAIAGHGPNLGDDPETQPIQFDFASLNGHPEMTAGSMVETALAVHDEVTRTAAISSPDIVAQIHTSEPYFDLPSEMVIEASEPRAPERDPQGSTSHEDLKPTGLDSHLGRPIRVSHARYVAAGVLRSSRCTPEGRPSSRRAGGRVGIPPRVRLSRE